MKVLSLVSVQRLQSSKFYLFGIVVGLVAYQLLLTWQIGNDVDQLIINALFWGAILYLLWGKRDKLSLESEIFSSIFGLLLIVLVLFKSISLFWFETSFLRVIPLTTACGLALLASGMRGLKQYWKELIILLLLSLPPSLFVSIINHLLQITVLTAKVATFILWYLGFTLSRQGDTMILNGDAVMVTPECTGISTALLLIKLATIYILIFPTNWRKRLLSISGAIGISFIISTIRVALLATVVSDRAAFHYWHGGTGNQIFSTVSILCFGFFCHYFLFAKHTDRLKNTQSNTHA